MRRLACAAMMLIITVIILGGCPNPPAPAPQAGTSGPTQPAVLTIFAASSLTEPLEQYNRLFQQSHPGLEVRLNLAGTQELKLQLDQGAEGDVFVSAAQKPMDELVKDGLVVEAREMAQNRLCLVTEPHSAAVKSLEDLRKQGVRLVVAVPGSPIGKYTRECWEKMIQSPQFGHQFVAAMERNVVSEETNVKLVLSKVLLGEADAGFVYVSDAKGKAVQVIELPDDIQVIAKYSVGRIAATRAVPLADEYVAGLVAPEGQAILQAAGLMPPSGKPLVR